MQTLVQNAAQSRHPVPQNDAPAPIRNLVTGEKMWILISTRDSEGDEFLVRFELPSTSHGSPLHLHSFVHETFTVVSGALEMEAGIGNVVTLRAGEVLDVPVGVPHRFANVSGAPVVFESRMTPAGEFEKFLRGWYGLGAAGLSRPDGAPKNLFHMARLVQAADFYFPGPAVGLQRALIRALAALGRLTGAEKTLHPFWV